MRYIDVCSGISAPTAAWKPLGWQALCYAEIEAAPRAVLAHHYPDVPLVGDFTQIQGTEYGPVDLLVGGTPCQSFSIAGLRGGLADGRGNLALEYLRLADRARPRWLVWENVPGVLSSNGGRDFGAILGGMGELGYGFAYRVLDAQHFGVPQRRRRVFVVGHLGDWRRAAAVLFERHGMSGHPAPRRETREDVARSLRAQSQSSHRADSDNFVAAFGGNNCAGPIDVACALASHGGPHGRQDFASETFIAFSAKDYGADAMENCSPTLRAGGFRESHANAGVMPAVAYAIQERAVSENLDAGPQGKGFQADVGYTLEARNKVQAVAFDLRNGTADEMAMSIQAGGMGDDRGLCPNAIPHTLARSAVRRLTPRECERLQGFPDDFTLVPYRNRMMADGPRYKMLGNSMAVPVMAWIGQRIAMVDATRPSPAPPLAAISEPVGGGDFVHGACNAA